MELVHTVGIGLTESSVCPNCLEGTITIEHNGEHYFAHCYTCDYEKRNYFTRYVMRYPEVKVITNGNSFASMEKYDSEGNVYVPFVVDIDDRDEDKLNRVLRKLETIAGKVFNVYDSGNKGYHIELPFKTWHSTSTHWYSLFRAMCHLADIGEDVDYSIFARNALLRIPDSLNAKSLSPKVLISEAESTTLLEGWQKLVEEAQQYEPIISSGSGDMTPFDYLRYEIPPCIQNLWLNGIPAPHTRHEAYLHLISYHYRRGDELEEAEQAATDFAQSFSENTDTPEAQRIVEAQRLAEKAFSNGLSFYCERGQELGICEEKCRIFRK